MGMPPGGAKGGLAGQLQAMQKQMLEAQEALGEKTVEITAGGGAIKVVMTGHQNCNPSPLTPKWSTRKMSKCCKI